MERNIILVLSLIYLIGITWLGFYEKWFRKEEIPVLLFHQLGSEFENYNVPKNDFIRLLDALDKHQIKVLSLQEYENKITNKVTFPLRAVLLTFDDGLLSFYNEIWPLLKEREFSAVVFVIPEFVGQTRYHEVASRNFSVNLPDHSRGTILTQQFMDWEQLRELSRTGIDIQSHTLKHRPLRTMSFDAIKQDYVNSREIIEKELDQSVYFLSYPWGEEPLEANKILSESGYISAFCCDRPVKSILTLKNNACIPRYEISVFTSELDLKLIIHGWMPCKEKLSYCLSYMTVVQVLKGIIKKCAKVNITFSKAEL